MAAVEPPHAEPEPPQPASPTEPTNMEEDLHTLASYYDRLAASSALTVPAGPNVAPPPPPPPPTPTAPTNLPGLVPMHPRLAAHVLSTLEVPAWHGALRTVDLNRLENTWRDEGGQRDGDGDVGADDDAYAQGGFGGVPASGDAMAALPETKVGEGEAAAEECAVCLEGYEAGDTVRTMPCAHGFHERCILGWLAVSRLCPLCRFKLPPAEEDSDAEDEGWESGDYGEIDDDDEDDVAYWHARISNSAVPTI